MLKAGKISIYLAVIITITCFHINFLKASAPTLISESILDRILLDAFRNTSLASIPKNRLPFFKELLTSKILTGATGILSLGMYGKIHPNQNELIGTYMDREFLSTIFASLDLSLSGDFNEEITYQEFEKLLIEGFANFFAQESQVSESVMLDMYACIIDAIGNIPDYLIPSQTAAEAQTVFKINYLLLNALNKSTDNNNPALGSIRDAVKKYSSLMRKAVARGEIGKGDFVHMHQKMERIFTRLGNNLRFSIFQMQNNHKVWSQYSDQANSAIEMFFKLCRRFGIKNSHEIQSLKADKQLWIAQTENMISAASLGSWRHRLPEELKNHPVEKLMNIPQFSHITVILEDGSMIEGEYFVSNRTERILELITANHLNEVIPFFRIVSIETRVFPPLVEIGSIVEVHRKQNSRLRGIYLGEKEGKLHLEVGDKSLALDISEIECIDNRVISAPLVPGNELMIARDNGSVERATITAVNGNEIVFGVLGENGNTASVIMLKEHLIALNAVYSFHFEKTFQRLNEFFTGKSPINSNHENRYIAFFEKKWPDNHETFEAHIYAEAAVFSGYHYITKAQKNAYFEKIAQTSQMIRNGQDFVIARVERETGVQKINNAKRNISVDGAANAVEVYKQRLMIWHSLLSNNPKYEDYKLVYQGFYDQILANEKVDPEEIEINGTFVNLQAHLVSIILAANHKGYQLPQ